MPAIKTGTCPPVRCECRGGCHCAAYKFGPPHVGEYTLWLVSFSGRTWIPVRVVQAVSWYDAREQGERMFPWVERPGVEASPGNQLSLFEENARQSLARYVASKRLQQFMSQSARTQPQAPTQTASASSGSSSPRAGSSSSPIRRSTPIYCTSGAKIA